MSSGRRCGRSRPRRANRPPQIGRPAPGRSRGAWRRCWRSWRSSRRPCTPDPSAGPVDPAVDGRRKNENERTAVGSEADTLSVTIFGSEYKIKGADPKYIRNVAAYVDAKMRELETRLAAGNPTRIAILASLNIADELFRERAERDRLDGELVDRAKTLSRALGETLRDR